MGLHPKHAAVQVPPHVLQPLGVESEGHQSQDAAGAHGVVPGPGVKGTEHAPGTLHLLCKPAVGSTLAPVQLPQGLLPDLLQQAPVQATEEALAHLAWSGLGLEDEVQVRGWGCGTLGAAAAASQNKHWDARVHVSTEQQLEGQLEAVVEGGGVFVAHL